MKQLKQKFIVADGTRLKPNKKNQRQNLDEGSYLRWKCKYHAKLNILDMVQNKFMCQLHINNRKLVNLSSRRA